MAGKLYFVTHVLPLRKTALGKEMEGLDFLYALDALAKATSRAEQSKSDWDAWCVREWGTFVKGGRHDEARRGCEQGVEYFRFRRLDET